MQPEATPDTAPQAAYVDPAFMVASAALAVGQPQTPVLAVEAA